MNKPQFKNQINLIFLHIPKTGGRTFYNILVRQYKSSEILNLEKLNKEISTSGDSYFSLALQKKAVEKLIKMPEEEKRKIKCVTQGHLGYGLDIFFPQKIKYIAFLRNPLDRAISSYYYMLSRPNHPAYYKIRKMSLEDYLWNFSEEEANSQVRMIVGEKGKIKRDPLSKKDLDLAKRRLKNHFAFVGLAERFNESLLCMKKKFSWKNVYYYKSNISKNRPKTTKIPKAITQAFEEKNKLDLELHRFAENLLEKSIADYGPDFKNDLLTFRKNLPILGRLLYLKRILSASPQMYKNKIVLKIGEIKSRFAN